MSSSKVYVNTVVMLGCGLERHFNRRLSRDQERVQLRHNRALRPEVVFAVRVLTVLRDLCVDITELRRFQLVLPEHRSGGWI